MVMWKKKEEEEMEEEEIPGSLTVSEAFILLGQP